VLSDDGGLAKDWLEDFHIEVFEGERLGWPTLQMNETEDVVRRLP